MQTANTTEILKKKKSNTFVIRYIVFSMLFIPRSVPIQTQQAISFFRNQTKSYIISTVYIEQDRGTYMNTSVQVYNGEKKINKNKIV